MVRDVGARFQCEKLTLFSTEIGDLEHPWEMGAEGGQYVSSENTGVVSAAASRIQRACWLSKKRWEALLLCG